MSRQSAYQVKLPDQPVDGYKVRYFSIRENSVQEITLKYHVNSKWSDVCDDDPGADFVDQWQVFTDGYFSGRISAWNYPATMNHQGHYEARKDAALALQQDFERRAKSYEERAEDYRSKAKEVAETELAAQRQEVA